MKSKTTSKFWKYYSSLPQEIQKKAKEIFIQFNRNPWYPSLRFKRIHSSEPIYSVRITRDYRAIGVLKDDCIIWFWIGSHSDYEKLISQFNR